MRKEKNPARMIGMRPRLLLSSPWYSFWPLQGNPPVGGQQPVGTGSLLLLPLLPLLSFGASWGSLRDSWEP